MVATLMCLLAVVSFAENQPDASRGTVTLEDNTVLELYDEEGDALIWYISGTEAVGETTKNVYSYIEAQDPRVTYTATNWQGSINGVGVNQVETISLTVDGVTYPTSKFVVFNIKDDDVAINAGPSKIGQSVNCLQKSFNGSKSIEYVYLREDFLAFQANAFSNCSNLKYLNFEELGSLVNLTSQAFSGCNDLLVGQTLDLSKTKLTNMQSNAFAYTGFTSVILPSTVTTFSGSAFENTAITSITIPDTITSFGAYVFKKCSKLTTVTGFAALFERGALTGIPGSTFENCSMLTSVDFPSSFTSIGGSAFLNCSSLTGTFKVSNNCSSIGSQAFQGAGFETIVLGGTYTELGNYSFRDMKKLKNVYISSKITSIPSEVFRSTSNVCFYYTGSSAQGLINVTVDSSGYNNTILKCPAANQIHFDNWDPTTRQSGQSYIIYGVNECFAFYDNKHTLTGTDCTKDDTCKICALPIAKQAEHTLLEALVYANGFTENGVYTCDCTFNGCTAVDIKAGDEGSSRAPLFNGGEGFSTKGEDGIAGGYTINVDGVNEYKRINGTLTFGIMVVNPNYYYGKDSFFDTNGKVNTSGGALQVEFTNNQYQNVNVSLTGFAGAEGLSLVIALYAYDDAENVEFIQSTTTKCGDKNVTVGGETLYTVTLASVKAGANDLSSLGDYTIEEPQKKEEQA